MELECRRLLICLAVKLKKFDEADPFVPLGFGSDQIELIGTRHTIMLVMPF